MFWAWERRENFDFIDPAKVGVAFLAKTLSLRGENIVTRPRMQPLTVPDRTKMMAVVRIETDHMDHPRLSARQLEQTATEIAELARLPNIYAVQIDFDATVSERSFYKELLWKVRQQLPPAMPLSITALASWCEGDNWLSDLPIDEAVPMLFRLGVDSRHFASRLESGKKFPAAICQHSAGVSTDEPIARPEVERLYVFNPKSWSQAAVNSMENYKR